MKNYEYFNELEGKNDGFYEQALEMILADIEEIYKISLDIDIQKIRFMRYVDFLLANSEKDNNNTKVGKMQMLYEELTKYGFVEENLSMTECMLPQICEGDDVGELTVNQILQAMRPDYVV